MIHKISFFLFLILFRINFAQVSKLKNSILSNKYTLIDIKYNDKSNLNALENFYYKEISYKPKMEMSAIIYDTSKASHKKMLRNLGFSNKDTLVIYDWDPIDGVYPFNVCAAKLKLIEKDSTLIFYDIKDISRNSVSLKKSWPIRNFKIKYLEKNKFTLLDKDNTDVRRTYVFKLISTKSK